MRDEVIPKNILMIGPTGVGKTEIARRLATLARAPFVKVEATKFTEVGYVGRDVDSMVRDLGPGVPADRRAREDGRGAREGGRAGGRPHSWTCCSRAASRRPPGFASPSRVAAKIRWRGSGSIFHARRPVRTGGGTRTGTREDPEENDDYAQRRREQEARVRERLRQQIASGVKDGDSLEIEVEESGGGPFMQVLSPQGMEDMGMDMQGLFGSMMPKKRKRRTLTISEAKEHFTNEEAKALIDQDQLTREAVSRAEQSGIIFVDEMDKIAGRGAGGGSGPDVSREGVQRDILPIIEGSTVQTKYGPCQD